MRSGFALEYSLGHATHAQNLKRVVASDATLEPVYVDLPYHDTPGAWSQLPLVRSNWSVRASLSAYLALRTQVSALQAALFHTQVTSLFSAGLMRRLPSVVSLDATPLQIDEMGRFYNHAPSGNPRIEALKKRLTVRALTAATRIVAWSEWTKRSLIADYGLPAAKIAVIPPGVDVERWAESRPVASRQGPLHLLFVGGDFNRKGGPALLEAFRRLPPALNAQLHLVTAEEVGGDLPDVHVYRHLTPNSDELFALYRQADIFVFPTQADCLPFAVLEAAAAGLPIIATQVGALAEIVIQAETGWIVPPDDVAALTEALRLLAADPALRARLGCRAREVAQERFNATTNYRRLLGVLKGIAR